MKIGQQWFSGKYNVEVHTSGKIGSRNEKVLKFTTLAREGTSRRTGSLLSFVLISPGVSQRSWKKSTFNPSVTLWLLSQRELSKRSKRKIRFKTHSANVTNPINMLICFSVRWTRFELEFVGCICSARARFSIFNSQEVIFLLLEYGLVALESNVNRNSL